MKYFVFTEMLNSSILHRGYADCDYDPSYRRRVSSPELQRELVHLYFYGNILKVLLYLVVAAMIIIKFGFGINPYLTIYNVSLTLDGSYAL